MIKKIKGMVKTSALVLAVSLMCGMPVSAATEEIVLSGTLTHTHTEETGACYNPLYHEHTAETGICYNPVYHVHTDKTGTCFNPVYHSHSGSNLTGGGCYGIKNYHTHTGSSQDGGGCYGTANYHTHTGDTVNGGSCYGKPIYHVHTGDATNGGGCYTVETTHTHDGYVHTQGACYSERCTGTWVTPFGTHYIHTCSTCNSGYVYNAMWSEQTATVGATCTSHYTPHYKLTCLLPTGTCYELGCGMTETSIVGYELDCDKNNTVIDSYSTNCGKTEETVDSYSMNCGKTEGTSIDDYTLVCVKTPGVTVDSYSLVCTKTPGVTIDSYALNCTLPDSCTYEVKKTEESQGNKYTVTCSHDGFINSYEYNYFEEGSLTPVFTNSGYSFCVVSNNYGSGTLYISLTDAKGGVHTLPGIGVENIKLVFIKNNIQTIVRKLFFNNQQIRHVYIDGLKIF